MKVTTLGPMRHACTGCGGSCHGVRVRLVGDEAATVVAAALLLGVADPIDGDHLRREGGRCVFLDDAMRCRIHAAIGPAHKPHVCRQYPLVQVTAGFEVRRGVDPGCYSGWAQLDDGPLADVSEAIWPHEAPMPPGGEDVERAVLALLAQPGITLEGGLRALSGAVGTGLPPGLPERWIAAAARADLGGVMARGAPGDAVVRALTPLVDALPRWAEAAPPEVEVPGPAGRWAIEVARRLVFLRLGPSALASPGNAFLALGGGLLLSWIDPTPSVFGPAMAAWTRAVRAPVFWQALFPEPAVLIHVLRGGGRAK